MAFPAVQTKLGKSATNYLCDEFGVDINIEKVDLSILGKVNFKNVYIRDHHSDTLIYVKYLKSSIYSFRKILKNKLEFDKISLDKFKLYIKTYKNETDDALTIFADKFGVLYGADAAMCPVVIEKAMKAITKGINSA